MASKANTNGEVITRNYNWRNLDWIDKISKPMSLVILIYSIYNIPSSRGLNLKIMIINLTSSVQEIALI